MKSRLSFRRLLPASGGFEAGNVVKVIRFVRMGCANRPFYHIVVAARKREQHDQCIEQVGSFDPMPNERNEKFVAINFERVNYWIGHGVGVSRPVATLFGLAGWFPIHPRTYMTAWRNRKAAVEKDAAAEKIASDKDSSGEKCEAML